MCSTYKQSDSVNLINEIYYVSDKDYGMFDVYFYCILITQVCYE